MHVPGSMRFTPGRTGILNTSTLQMKRRDIGAVQVDLAERIGRERRGRVATRIGGGRPGVRITRWIKLRQTIECLIGNSILRPILPHRSEVTVERAVLLRQENNVIDALQARAKGSGHVAPCK